jgi:RNA polymerase sigma-70 factor (ECF subfamily)
VSTCEPDLMRALHDQHAAAVWAYVLRLTSGDRGRAQDVLQETLLRAWRHPEVLQPERGSARAWLFTTARHIVIDEWRARSVRPELLTDSVPDLATPDGVDEAMQSWLVAEALDRLSPEHRTVLVECFYRGHTVAEAAERIGVPVGTVKSRTHYALRALRLVLQEMGVTQ